MKKEREGEGGRESESTEGNEDGFPEVVTRASKARCQGSARSGDRS